MLDMSEDADRENHEEVVRRPINFSWIWYKKLAGTGKPMSKDEIAWLVKQGVGHIITTTEEPLDKSWIDGIECLHLPTPDLKAPSEDFMDRAVVFIHNRVLDKDGKSVVVHCHAGLGRTGCILACYMIRHMGYTAERAIRHLRNERPGSIQSKAQEDALYAYEKRKLGFE